METLASLVASVGYIICLVRCFDFGLPPYLIVITMLCILASVMLELGLDSLDVARLESQLGWKLRRNTGQGSYCTFLIPMATIISSTYSGGLLKDDFHKMLILLSISTILITLGVQCHAAVTAPPIYQMTYYDSGNNVSGPSVPYLYTVLHLILTGCCVGVLLVVLMALPNIGLVASGLLCMHSGLLFLSLTSVFIYLPRCFTLGEAALCSHTVVYFTFTVVSEFFVKAGWIAIKSPLLTEVSKLTTFTQVAVQSSMLVVLLLVFIPALRTTICFHLLVPGVMLVFSLPVLYFYLEQDFISFMVEYVTSKRDKKRLFLYWFITCIIAVLIVIINARRIFNINKQIPCIHQNADDKNTKINKKSDNLQHVNKSADDLQNVNKTNLSRDDKLALRDERQCITTVVRKQFHVLAVAIFVPGLVADREILCCAATCALVVLVMMECLRVLPVYPWGQALETSFQVFKDNKDKGPVLLTHMYLLVGCTLPLWLLGDKENHIALYSGVISLGIGDTVASVIGSKFGKINWPDTNKTVEGSVSAIIVQLILIAVAIHYGYCPTWSWSHIILAVILTSILEAVTNQVDNIVLPLFMYMLILS